MGDLSRNFSRKEFACKCGCGFDTVDAELINVMQMNVRDRFGKILVPSGCRCYTHNIKSGGSKSSQHLKGKACDFIATEHDMEYIYDYLCNKFPDKFGIGAYIDKEENTVRIHFDVRSACARWTKPI